MSNFRQCPYDPLHKIAAKTFALHLVKCKRQHPDIKLATCYFDSSHLVKEEELKQHMRTCSGRQHLLAYKTTIDTTSSGSACKREDPAENLIYNTDEPAKQCNDTGGQSLQDDTECWDDFAYKPYDPLANCKSKLQSSKLFILPNPNKFAGQMQAAAASIVKQQLEQKNDEDGALSDQEEAGLEDEAEQKYYPTGDEDSSIRQCEVKESASDYDDAVSRSSSRKDRKERYFEAPSSSRRYEASDETSYRVKTERSSHRTGERSRSDSTSSSDRKSQVYEGYYDGYTYRGSYDASRAHRADRGYGYEADAGRGRYDRQGEHHRTSSRSYDSRKHKYEPYQKFQRSYDNSPRRGRDYE